MLTLDPTLAAAQNSQTRNPLVEIISTSTVPDIPFDGQKLLESVTSEQRPNVIMHSSGRICHIFTFGNNFKYAYTDVDRNTFSFVDITCPVTYVGIEACLCELTDGSIGIVFYGTASGQEKIWRMVISVTGIILTSASDILSYATSGHVLSSPYIIKLSSNTYFLVYTDKTVTGATYSFRKRTSSDFITWSAEGTCSVGGLTNTKETGNLSLLQISTGQLWMWFNYVDAISGGNILTNIYYSTSSDSGVTWDAAVKFTNFVTYDVIGQHPFAVQKVANQMHIIFNEIKSLLSMDSTFSGWTCGNSYVRNLQIDSVNGKLYLVIAHQPPADQWRLDGIVKVDIATWTVNKCWDGTSVPSIPNYWRNGTCPVYGVNCHGEKHLVIVSNYGGTGNHILMLDGQADTIREWHFEDQPTLDPPVTRNVNVGSINYDHINSTWLDYASNRIYVCWTKYVFGGTCYYGLGYLLTTEVGSMVDLHKIFENPDIGWYEMAYTAMANFTSDLVSYVGAGILEIAANDGYAIFYFGIGPSTTFARDGTQTLGRTRIHLISDGSLYKNYDHASTSGYPFLALWRGKISAGKIWGIYPGYNGSNPVYQQQLGFCEINISTDAISHHHPPWPPIATGNYGYLQLTPSQDTLTIFLNCQTKGIALYDIASDTWTLYDNNSVPGMNVAPNDYTFYGLTFDDANARIYFGEPNGVRAFSLYGVMKQSYYSIGTFTTIWSWSSLSVFCLGYADYDAVAALVASDHTMFVFWTKDDKGSLYIKWDKEGSTLDLSSYLIRGEEIAIHRSIDGRPSSLDFSLSDGHLFDPYNANSLKRIYVKKGRKLTLRLGERVSGSNYWANQGIFYINEVSLSYERGQYPSMRIRASDMMSFWENAQITVSPYYNNYPEDILSNILTTFMGLTSGDISLPTFTGRELLTQQWLETMVKDVIDQVCRRFGYFPRVNADGKFSAGLLSESSAVSHTYSDLTKIIHFSPDDSFSDFTNRVTVVGQENNEVEVTYDEERIQALHGTVGWWGFKKDFQINYSVDGSRRVKEVRLKILESTASIGFQLAGGKVTETISYSDPDRLYCIVTVSAPNLIPQIIAAIAIYIAGCLMPDGVIVAGFGASGGYTIPIGRLVERVGLTLVILILASIGNYQFEIWGKPTGFIRKTVQAISDDTELQNQIGMIVQRKFEDPLCTSIAACQTVANYELMIARLQRKRAKFSKMADLRDEEADIIQINHPYTGLAMKVLVTDLTRKMLIPASPGGDGYFQDELECWVIN